MEHFDKSEDSE